MVKLTKGFKLSNPWANEVVKGRLNFLIRALSTKNRGRVVVIATKIVDPIWSGNVSEEEIIEMTANFGAIGSIEIKDCLEVDLSELEEKLIDLAGKNYWDRYPKHMVPARWPFIHIWILDKPKKWKKSKKIESRGMTWVNIDLLDSDKNAL